MRYKCMNSDLEMIPFDELTLYPPPLAGQASLIKRGTKIPLLLLSRRSRQRRGEGDRG